MKRGVRRQSLILWIALPVVAAGAIAAREVYVTRPVYGLPWSTQFAANEEDRWNALGGTWEVVGGAMRNDSNDRGAKLLTGSPHWKDYTVEADVQLLGSGSAGLLARVSEAELGENSFKGYFVAVRSADNSFVLGSFNFAYHEVSRIEAPEGIRLFHWYHLRLEVNGCRITASASSAGMRDIRTEPLNDPDCFRSGMVGLRSNGTGGLWRNVTVRPAGMPEPGSSRAPIPADTPSVSKISGTRNYGLPPAQAVASLQYLSPSSSPMATVRGSVVMIRPAIYVQDSTGGIEVEPQGSTPVKVGDEVEVTGRVSLSGFSPVLQKADIRILREDVPVSPVVLTANQIATGTYDGRFVQVDARLLKISTGPAGILRMDLDAGSQTFHAILPRGRTRWHLRPFAPESRVRIRGVSVVDRRFDTGADPFVILVRSAEDIDLIAGPPWWSPSTLILSGLVVLALTFLLNHLYLRVKHWRLRAVAEERERLAHEIHDTLAQSFAGIGFQLQAIRNSLPPGAGQLQRQVELAMLMTRTSHEEARRSIASLHPQSLGSAWLLPALRECAEKMVRNGAVVVETKGDTGGRGLPSRIKDTLYRIGQEAIANSIRHASPNKIRIVLEREGSAVCLSVEDDGKGFVTDPECAGFGLPGMRKKAESISATLNIQSSPGSGTRVEVRAPVGSRLRSALSPRGALLNERL